MKPCIFILGAFNVLLLRPLFSKFVILAVKQSECVIIQIQFQQAAFIIDRNSCPIFHSLGHIVNVDIVAENLPCIVIVLFDGSTRKADKCGMRQKFTHNSCKTEFQLSCFSIYFCFGV